MLKEEHVKIHIIFLFIILLAVIGLLYSINRNEIFLKWEKIGLIATLLTAIVTFFMVLEMRWAREQDVKPEIIITAPIYRYEFRWIPKEDLSPVIRPELQKEEINKYETRSPVFGIKNIGKASALNLEITWKFSTDLNNLKANSFIKDFHPSIENGLFCLSKSTEGGSTKNCFLCLNSEKTYLPYCVATPSAETIQPLPLPTGVSGAYDVALITKDRPNAATTIISGDNIEIEIKYIDLNDKEFHKRFIVTSELLYLPDTVTSSSNSVEEKYYSDLNIRGSIRFNVIPDAAR
jgi:hypothetical protein